eukprot:scaffold12821_cov92-Isochrysis_galbana.AAC.3
MSSCPLSPPSRLVAASPPRPTRLAKNNRAPHAHPASPGRRTRPGSLGSSTLSGAAARPSPAKRKRERPGRHPADAAGEPVDLIQHERSLLLAHPPGQEGHRRNCRRHRAPETGERGQCDAPGWRGFLEQARVPAADKAGHQHAALQKGVVVVQRLVHGSHHLARRFGGHLESVRTIHQHLCAAIRRVVVV